MHRRRGTLVLLHRVGESAVGCHRSRPKLAVSALPSRGWRSSGSTTSWLPARFTGRLTLLGSRGRPYDRRVTLAVIGAGFGRTGTLSLKAAL
jgi:hypothetical protein